MKIVCVSDLHGYLPKDLPGGDVLVIAGDICPADDHSVGHQKWWLENRFNLWLKSLAYRDIVLVAGNHDFIFEQAPGQVPKLHCNYLQDSSVIIDHIKFYGHPHTPQFYDWAFMHNPQKLQEFNSYIPDDTNVLITHGPAYGILDMVGSGRKPVYCSPGNLGCQCLRNRIDELKDLKLHVCGHIHSGHGIVVKDNTTFVNASYINECYDPDYDIVVVDI